MAEPSVLDERLAEIDRRLRAIQSGLDPIDATPATPRPVPTPLRAAPDSAEPAAARHAPTADTAEPAPGAAPTAGTALQPAARPAPITDGASASEPAPAAELVGGLQELLEFHQRLLTSTAELLETYADALVRSSASRGSSAAVTASISVGPLQTTEALRDFQRALSELPQVGDVAVREFEGEDRAVIDVHLARPTS